MKLSLEQCTSIFIANLQKEIRRLIGKDYVDASSEETHELTRQELEKFSVNGQTFEYTSIKNHLGGYRWFFLCPRCKKRVSKLFLPPENSTLDAMYLCKNCHGLINQSAMMGQNKIYKNVTRPLKRMREIEKKIDKGHLTPEKIKKLLDEWDNLDKKMKSTTEYRLYVFKKKREQEKQNREA